MIKDTKLFAKFQILSKDKLTLDKLKSALIDVGQESKFYWGCEQLCEIFFDKLEKIEEFDKYFNTEYLNKTFKIDSGKLIKKGWRIYTCDIERNYFSDSANLMSLVDVKLKKNDIIIFKGND
jgi:hypothetical protein